MGSFSGRKRDIISGSRMFAAVLLLALAALLFLSVLRTSIFSDVSEDKRIWFELSFLLLAAIGAELLVNHLKQPFVMVLLLAGVAISPSAIETAYPILQGALGGFLPLPQAAPHLVQPDGLVVVFAKLGAILLLFRIGIHSETGKIFNSRNLSIALLGVVVPFLGGYLFAILSGHSFYYALFLGAALTATSVGVTVAVLEELRMLQSDIAQAILGAAVIDDVLALLVLSLIQNIPASADFASLSPLLSITATAAVFVVGGIALGRFVVVNYFDPFVGGAGDPKRGFLAMLAWLLLYAYIAEFIGLSAIVGAFVAGITMNYSRKTADLLRWYSPLEAFFTPLFFISLGLLVDLQSLAENIAPILLLTAIAIAAKVIGCGSAALATGSRPREAIAIGVGMMPRGEIALIIGLYGLSALTPAGEHILGPAEYSLIVSMAFLTTIFAPLAIKAATKRE